MGKVLWEIAKAGSYIVGAIILLALAGGGSEGPYTTQSKSTGHVPRARIYQPTGRSKGYGSRIYHGTKSYW